MKRYAIWDKVSPVITPSGKVYTAEQWIEKYPVAALENIIVVCSFGEINGGYFGILSQMMHECEAQGVDFSACETAEEVLVAIEAFEDAINNAPAEPSAEERQAAALEAIAMGATSETTAVMNALLTGEEM